MPRIDFYILQGAEPRGRERFACRLIERAVSLGHAVFVRAASLEAARDFDVLMWTYSDRSFLPHELADGVAPPSGRAPVLIGTGAAPPGHRALLVNLTSEQPLDLEAVERVAEIVDDEPERRRLARERFRQYRERGFELETHSL